MIEINVAVQLYYAQFLYFVLRFITEILSLKKISLDFSDGINYYKIIEEINENV